MGISWGAIKTAITPGERVAGAWSSFKGFPEAFYKWEGPKKLVTAGEVTRNGLLYIPAVIGTTVLKTGSGILHYVGGFFGLAGGAERAAAKETKGITQFFSKHWGKMAAGGAVLVGASMLMGGQDKERYDTAYNDTINQLNGMNAASPQIMAGAGNAQQMGTLQQMQMQRG